MEQWETLRKKYGIIIPIDHLFNHICPTVQAECGFLRLRKVGLPVAPISQHRIIRLHGMTHIVAPVDFGCANPCWVTHYSTWVNTHWKRHVDFPWARFTIELDHIKPTQGHQSEKGMWAQGGMTACQEIS